MAKFDLTSGKTWKRLITVLLSLLLLAGAIFGVVKIADKLNEESKKVSTTWAIGVIDETTGKPNGQAKTSIYTNDVFEAKGLEIILDFDNDVTYQVFWYDKLGAFYGCTEELTEGSEIYAPYGCRARVEVTPNFTYDEGKDAIAWYETYKYSRQIEIRVDKEQNYKLKDFADVKLTNTNYFEPHVGWYQTETGTFDDSEGMTGYTSYIYVNNTKTTTAVFVEKYSLSKGALYVRLKDGSVMSFFSSNGSDDEFVREKKLPMTPDKAVFLPEGATLIVIGLFGDTGAENTVLRFY